MSHHTSKNRSTKPAATAPPPPAPAAAKETLTTYGRVNVASTVKEGGTMSFADALAKKQAPPPKKQAPPKNVAPTPEKVVEAERISAATPPPPPQPPADLTQLEDEEINNIQEDAQSDTLTPPQDRKVFESWGDDTPSPFVQRKAPALALTSAPPVKAPIPVPAAAPAQPRPKFHSTSFTYETQTERVALPPSLRPPQRTYIFSSKKPLVTVPVSMEDDSPKHGTMSMTMQEEVLGEAEVRSPPNLHTPQKEDLDFPNAVSAPSPVLRTAGRSMSTQTEDVRVLPIVAMRSTGMVTDPMALPREAAPPPPTQPQVYHPPPPPPQPAAAPRTTSRTPPHSTTSRAPQEYRADSQEDLTGMTSWYDQSAYDASAYDQSGSQYARWGPYGGSGHAPPPPPERNPFSYNNNQGGSRRNNNNNNNFGGTSGNDGLPILPPRPGGQGMPPQGMGRGGGGGNFPPNQRGGPTPPWPSGYPPYPSQMMGPGPQGPPPPSAGGYFPPPPSMQPPPQGRFPPPPQSYGGYSDMPPGMMPQGPSMQPSKRPHNTFMH